ncbi:hypothetical protein O4H52_07880 [Sphingomonadaceae bacterium G21617-S1]|nr:hypothetical protein [Sphingomonadaceae bacterium G21617-S1]
MFDITQFTPTDTTFVHLKSPITEEKLYLGKGDAKEPVGITFHSPGSEGYEAAETARTDRALVRSKRKIELTAAILRADAAQFLADITVSSNLAYPDAGDATGEDLYKALYADRRFRWAIEQSNTHLSDLGNSMRKSQPN